MKTRTQAFEERTARIEKLARELRDKDPDMTLNEMVRLVGKAAEHWKFPYRGSKGDKLFLKPIESYSGTVRPILIKLRNVGLLPPREVTPFSQEVKSVLRFVFSCSNEDGIDRAYHLISMLEEEISKREGTP